MLILTGSIWELIRGPFDGFLTRILSWIFLWIDSLIYYGVNLAYQTYIALASVRLFGDNTSVYITDLTERVYIVIGVIALFLVAYALLVAIINPDNANKGDKSLGKLIPNIAIAIVGMAIVPTVFDWAYKAQDLIMYNNIIQNIVLKNDENNVNAYNNAGADMATTLFQSFFHPTNYDGSNKNLANDIWSDGNDSELGEKINLTTAYGEARKGRSFSSIFLNFIGQVVDGKIEYLYLFSTIAGGFCCYVLISFCIDMAIRLFKLAYLQLISPLPILMNIIPGQKKVFQNWLKKTVSCFMEVFVRIFCISFVVFIVTHLVDFFDNLWPNGNQPTGIVVLLVHAFIIVGLFAFLKQAPKLVSEVMGIDSKGFKLGIKDKLAESGVFQAVGAVGGGVTAGIRNGVAAAQAPGKLWQKALGAIGSGVAGTFSGAAKGFASGKNAKNFTDARNAAGKAARDVSMARMRRTEYNKAHGGFFGGIAGHVGDAIDNVKDYPTDHRSNYSLLNERHKQASDIASINNKINDKAKSIMDKHVADYDYNGKSLEQIRQASKDVEQRLQYAIQTAELEKRTAQQEYNKASQDLAAAEAELTRISNQPGTTLTDRMNVESKIRAAKAAQAAAQGRFSNADQNTDNIRQALFAAQKEVKAAEKDIKNRIRSGAIQLSGLENEEMQGLYTDLQTAFRDGIAGISSSQAEFNEFTSYASKSNADFRQLFESNKVMDTISINDARVVQQMNKESQAARKQDEKK